MSATENVSIFREYEGELASLRKRQMKYSQFFLGKQYSKSDISKLRSFGLKPIVVNEVRPLIGQQAAILTSTKPTWKVLPQNGATKDVADIMGKYLVSKWNSDYVDIQYESAVRDCLVTGAGYLFIDVANFLDNSTFDIKIERLNWKYVYPDPNASKFDLSDAEHIFVAKEVGLKYAQVLYGMSESEAKSAADVQDTSSARVKIIDSFSKYPVERVEYNILVPGKDSPIPNLQYEKLPPSIFYTSALKNKVEEEKRNWVKELHELESEGKIELKKLKALNIHRCISVGNYTAYEGVMNIRDYPIILFSDEFTDEYKNLEGETNFLEGIQEATNKFYMLTIHNAMLTGNVRVIGPKDAITDKTAFQKTVNLPGAYIDWTPQPDLPNFGKPELIPPGQLSSAFYGLANDLMKKAEYETGVFSPVQGNPQGSPETFSTTASLQSFGTQRISRIARRLEIQLSKAGEVAIQFIQNYTRKNELLQYLDDQPYNQNGEPSDTYGTMVEAGTLNIETPSIEAVEEIKNSSKVGSFALKVMTQPNLGTDRMNKAAFMSNMVMNKTLPPLPSVMKKLFDLMEVPGYMEMVKELAGNSQNSAQVQELVKTVQMLQKQLVVTQNEATKLMKDKEVLAFRNSLDKQLLKIKDEVMGGKSALATAIMKYLQTPTEQQSQGEPSNGQAD